LPVRATAKSVLVADAAAGGIVRVGGMLVIVAVLGILVFLGATVVPLFRSAAVRERAGGGRVPVEGPLKFLALDEYRLLAAAVGTAPEVVWFRPDNGEVVTRKPIAALEGSTVVAASRTVRSGDAVAVSADGRVATLSVGFGSRFVLDAEAAPLRDSLAQGGVATYREGVVRRGAGGTLRHVRPRFEERGRASLPPGSTAVAAGYAFAGDAGAVLVATADGELHLARESVTSAPGGDETRVLEWAPISKDGPALPRDAFEALVDEEVRSAWVAGRAGVLGRIDLTRSPAVVRETKLVSRTPGMRLTAVGFVLGDRSLVVADDGGRVDVWSATPASSPPVDVVIDGAPWKLRSGTDVTIVPVDGAVATIAAAAERVVVVLGGATVVLEPGAKPLEVPEKKVLAVPPLHGDGRAILRLHEFEPFDSPVVHVASSSTRRTLYLGHADGTLSAAYPTNERVLGRVRAFTGPVAAAAPGSKDDGLLVAGPGLGFRAFDVDAPHPETSVASLFAPVHYEGYAEPGYVWQSTSGTDEAEPKLCLTPLLFGTLKGTFYAMIFALPLALLAALYTARFMHPSVRAVVKPSIEVMASLPSVVLGFLAALFIAPAIADVVPAVFATLAGVLVVGFLAGVVWHGLPLEARQAVGSAGRLAIATALVLGVAVASVLLEGPVQRLLFSGPANPTGDFKVWLRGTPGTGSGTPLLAVAGFFVGAVAGLVLLPRLAAPRSTRPSSIGVGLERAFLWGFLPGVAGLALAFLAAWAGFDFRRFLVGDDGSTFDVRNSLVVGIAMGFAVIPIVYTIAEDALSAIPDALNSAALACGASPWQAAVRVVVPAAAPGLFSASMIGLGRAVGETMIVVMATGGTAIIDGSIWNGFRSLSANIATELSEAPKDGTLYRVLFLAALLLFALTFVVNTVAEIVRIRFRRRFKAL
jgi:ABC-type uncharacterized transport system permease subunit